MGSRRGNGVGGLKTGGVVFWIISPRQHQRPWAQVWGWYSSFARLSTARRPTRNGSVTARFHYCPFEAAAMPIALFTGILEQKLCLSLTRSPILPKLLTSFVRVCAFFYRYTAAHSLSLALFFAPKLFGFISHFEVGCGCAGQRTRLRRCWKDEMDNNFGAVGPGWCGLNDSSTGSLGVRPTITASED